MESVEGGREGRGGGGVNILEQMLVISVSSVSAGLSRRVEEEDGQWQCWVCLFVSPSVLAVQCQNRQINRRENPRNEITG